jgi:hypothetical protein
MGQHNLYLDKDLEASAVTAAKGKSLMEWVRGLIRAATKKGKG